jgi:hypothetical protein
MSEIVQIGAGSSVLAFGSHVDAARLQQARDAGCAEVMPRSRLSNELPALLQHHCLAKDYQLRMHPHAPADSSSTE